MKKTLGYAARSSSSPLEPFAFERRDVGAHDVGISILFCGVCHSDIHVARNEWLQSHYPVVPGHEIIGIVSEVGPQVKSFKVGDVVAVGTFVWACGTCEACVQGLEQYCEKGFIDTFNSPDPYTENGVTYGGYSRYIVVNEKYVYSLPDALKKQDLASVAPLMCAGITVYSPLKHWGVGKGKKVGVVGIGGLGHMAIKFAHALGAEVIAITSTPKKIDDCKKFGTQDAFFWDDEAAVKKHAESFDFIISTLPVPYDENRYIDLLKRDGVLCVVGIPPMPLGQLRADKLILGRKSVVGSVVGGIKETKEMLEFCAQHNIRADVEIIPIDQINEAFDKVVNKEVRYRYVIDLDTLK